LVLRYSERTEKIGDCEYCGGKATYFYSYKVFMLGFMTKLTERFICKNCMIQRKRRLAKPKGGIKW